MKGITLPPVQPCSCPTDTRPVANVAAGDKPMIYAATGPAEDRDTIVEHCFCRLPQALSRQHYE